MQKKKRALLDLRRKEREEATNSIGSYIIVQGILKPVEGMDYWSLTDEKK